jgi:hypothetical protein
MDSIKTLIGKNNYLFLINDACRELEVHCENLNLVNDKSLSRYNLENFLLIVLPNKSLVYRDYLPDNYNIKYRPALNDYKKIFKNKLVDTYKILKNEEDVFYKTDTHINMKGNYFVYNYFIKKLNEIYNLDIKPHNIVLSSKNCKLAELNYGLGDLLWDKNLGNQNIDENSKIDNFYYSDNVEILYYNHKIKESDEIRILNKEFIDINYKLVDSLISWEILSENILYRKNNTDNNLKVLIFYDSFSISLLDLYLKLFNEVYMIKEIYNSHYIKTINPDYVFEFRVERFLF